MGEEAPKVGELGDGCRGSEKWENSQKGGSSSVGEGAWCWEGVVVREWRIRVETELSTSGREGIGTKLH